MLGDAFPLPFAVRLHHQIAEHRAGLQTRQDAQLRRVDRTQVTRPKRGRPGRIPGPSRSLGDEDVLGRGCPRAGVDVVRAGWCLDEGADRLAVGGRMAEVQRQAAIGEPSGSERAKRERRELIHVDAAGYRPAAEAERGRRRVVMNAPDDAGGEVTWVADRSCEHVDCHWCLP